MLPLVTASSEMKIQPPNHMAFHSRMKTCSNAVSPKSVQYFPLVVCPIKYFSEKKLLKLFSLNSGQFVKM